MISDEIAAMADGIPREIAQTLDDVAEAMVKSMQDKLTAGDHIDTGNLITSIHADTTADDSAITSDIYIDAQSEEGAWYAEFLEYGTGIYNESGNGRQTPWAWQDRHGEWHTTRGMRADPFIRPAFAAHVGELEDNVSRDINNLRRYKR